MVILHVIVQYTKLGRLCAVSMDKEVALLMGINVDASFLPPCHSVLPSQLQQAFWWGCTTIALTHTWG